MKRITRNQAAEKLGVTPQTISNYVQEGLLGGYKDVRTLYVNADDVEKFAEKYKLISVNERVLDEKLKELKRAKAQVDEELSEVRKGILGKSIKGACAENVATMVSSLFKLYLIPKIKEREVNVLVDFLKGEEIEDIASRYDLTRERKRQIIGKACRRLSNNVETINKTILNYYFKNPEIKNLKNQLESLKAEYNEYKCQKGDTPKSMMNKPPQIFSYRLDDYGFSVRITNIFKAYDIETVGDLMTSVTSMAGLLKFRNLGKRSLYSIGEFINKHHLLFYDGKENLEYYYYKQNKLLVENGEIDITE